MTKLLLMPTSCSHQVYVDAFKKLLLMGIIQGKEFKLPDQTPEKVRKLMRLDDGQSQQNAMMTTLEFDSYGLKAYNSVL